MRTAKVFTAALLFPLLAFAQSAAYSGAPHALTWIDRPWEYRYLLKVEDEKAFLRHRTDALDTPKDPDMPATASFFSAFAPSWIVQARDSENGLIKGQRFAVLRADIKEDRTVVTASDWGVPLEARLNWYQNIVLVPREPKPKKILEVGRFFMGHYGASDTRYSPSICMEVFGDDVLPAHGARGGRYVNKDFDPISHGYFGCREWAAQLYDSRRPYIDVTSYEYEVDYDKPPIKSGPHKGDYPLKKPLTTAPFIKHFIGFSRFEDPPKPVIGNHEGQWLCLNDCPDGDTPGQIADIKAWAAKRGWPVPQRPKNVREFMDKKVTPQDLDE